MTIGKKFFTTVSLILIACIILFNASLFLTLFGIKDNISNANSSSKEMIVKNITDNALDVAKETLYEYTYLFTQNTNNRFAYIEHNLTSLSKIAQQSYINGIDNVDILDYTLIKGTKLSSVEHELKEIYDFHKFLKHDTSVYLYGSNAYFCSESGIVINSPIQSKKHFVDTDLRKREWFTLAKKNPDKVVWCKPYEDLASEGIITSCSKAVFDEKNNFVGVVSIDFDDQILINGSSFVPGSSTVDNTLFSKYFLIDDSGKILLSSNNLSIENYIDKAALNNIWTIYKNAKDNINITTINENIISAAKLDINNWIVCFLVDSNAVSENANQTKNLITTLYDNASNNLDKKIVHTMWISIAIIFVLMIGAYAVSMWLTKSTITSPLDELSKGIKTIGKGNLKYRIKLNTKNELSELAELVNSMSRELEKNIKQVAKESAERQRMLTEVELGQTVQMSMLPDRLNSDNIDICAAMKPARFVGGDFYDYFYTDKGNIALVIGDVSGKGVASALFMSRVKAIINLTARSYNSPQKIMSITNKYLCQNNDDCMFVTAVIGIIDTKTLKLSYCVAGHYPPIVKESNTAQKLPTVNSVPLGINPNEIYKKLTYQLKKDDIIVLYTDGILESRNQNEQFFGEKNLIDCIQKSGNLSASDLNNSIIDSAVKFSEGCEQFDDMTVTVIKVIKAIQKNKNNLEDL